MKQIEPIHGLYLVLFVAACFICWGLGLLILGADRG